MRNAAIQLFSQAGAYSRTKLMVKLGIKGSKLPTHAIAPMALDDRFIVYLKPQGRPLPPTGPWDHPHRRMTHRLTIICPCQQHVPSGRMGQHNCWAIRKLAIDAEFNDLVITSPCGDKLRWNTSNHRWEDVNA